MRTHLCAVPLVIAVLAGQTAPAATPSSPGFYERQAEGWFWYSVDPDPPIETEPEPEPPTPTPVAEPEAPPAAPQPSVPRPMSVAWLKEQLSIYRDRAIDDPSLANVAAYLYLQRVSMDKAHAFADAAQRVVALDPVLDENTRRPLATYAANEMNVQAGRARAEVLAEIARWAGIWFFFRSDCPYCELQAPVLEVLENQYGFTVLPISLDGRAMPSGRFLEFKLDAGQGSALGVASTPAMFLASRDGVLVPLGQGALSLAELERRIVSAALEAGRIAPADVERTRPGPGPSPLHAAGDAFGPGAEAVPDDPALLVERLRAIARGEAESVPR